MPNPEWTSTPPMEPGWYWAVQMSGCRPECVHLQVEESRPSGLVVEIAGSHELVSLWEFDHWSGPIEPPPLPEDRG